MRFYFILFLILGFAVLAALALTHDKPSCVQGSIAALMTDCTP